LRARPTLRTIFGMADEKPRGRRPWELEERENCFCIKDADNLPLYSIFFYKGKEAPVPNPLHLMSWDAALVLARAMRELPELREMRRKAGELAAARDVTRESWIAALLMIREAVETLGPPGILPSKEAVGPEPTHEASAIVAALQRLFSDENPAQTHRTPWVVVENAESFEVQDADGNPLGFVYFEDDLKRNWAILGGRLTKDKARRVANVFARVPDLLTVEKQMKAGGNYDQSEDG
jgi:hypothetical protein